MEIDKKKCIKWCEKLMEFMQLTKEINHKEAKYIKANMSIAFANLELQEIEKESQYEIKTGAGGNKNV